MTDRECPHSRTVTWSADGLPPLSSRTTQLPPTSKRSRLPLQPSRPSPLHYSQPSEGRASKPHSSPVSQRTRPSPQLPNRHLECGRLASAFIERTNTTFPPPLPPTSIKGADACLRSNHTTPSHDRLPSPPIIRSRPKVEQASLTLPRHVKEPTHPPKREQAARTPKSLN